MDTESYNSEKKNDAEEAINKIEAILITKDFFSHGKSPKHAGWRAEATEALQAISKYR